jgi:hypothetical protein
MSGGRLMTFLRIFGAICVLVVVFLLGMWLTWPELPYNPSGFPINRKFVAIALNGEPLMFRDAPNRATFEVRGRHTFKHRAGGVSLCGAWGLPVTFLPGKRLLWGGSGGTWTTAVARCNAQAHRELDARYLSALLSAVQWRTQDGNLILHNGRDVLTFQLAPPGMAD